MPVLFALLAAIFVLLLTYVIQQRKRPLGYPPGPSWFPFIGNLPELKRLSKQLGGQHLALQKLAERYNTNVLGLKLGNEHVITVFSYNIVKKVLAAEEYEGRPDNFFIRLRCMGKRRGVTCTDGPLWKEQRHFITTHLKELGFGGNSMMLMIKEEIGEILAMLQKHSCDVQIGKLLAPSVINILWALVSGSRIDRNDPHLGKLLDLLDERTKVFDMSGGILTQHPWLRYIAPEKTGYSLIQQVNCDLKTLLAETIREHYSTWSTGNNDDLMYSFIGEIKTANGNATYFTEDQLIMVCLDLFIAGAQTTSNTLDFLFLAMILYPDIQKKVHSCIDEAFKQDEDINYQDRLRVQFIEAVILEVERCYGVVPLAGPRRVLRDTELEGYYIPKESTVLISLHSVHYDKEYWKDPEVFRPERFLGGDGKVINYDRVIPFGLGKRRCLGEILARHCVFLLFTEIMRKYIITLRPGTKQPVGVPLPGITLTPEKYRAQFSLR